MANKSEQALQKGILQYLKLKGIFAWKNHSTGIYDTKRNVWRTNTSIKGVSDILGIMPEGRLLAIEVKTKPNRPSGHQVEFIRNITEMGGLGFIAYSLDDVVKHIP